MDGGYEGIGHIEAGTSPPRCRTVEPSTGSNVIPRRARPGLAGLSGAVSDRGVADYRGTSHARKRARRGVAWSCE